MNAGRVVIIGAGQAGAATALALRRAGYSGSIVLAGDEMEAPYERPMLSKEMLARGLFQHRPIIDASEALAQKVDLRLGWRATGIDRVARVVKFAGGEELPYDRLVVATGGRAARPVPDIPAMRVLRTLSDARALEQALQRARRMLVIGGGWIGLEVASAAIERGVNVLLCEARERLCPRVLPAVAADFLLQLHRSKGVDVALGERPRISFEGNGFTIELSDRTEHADIAVYAAGMVPNDGLLAAAGLEVSEGVVTDPEGRTNDARIFAVGDCSVFQDRLCGERWQLQSWQNANLQAEAVAGIIVGRSTANASAPWFWSTQHGRVLSVAGMPAADACPDNGNEGTSERPVWRFFSGTEREAMVAIDRPAEVRLALRMLNQRRQAFLSASKKSG